MFTGRRFDCTGHYYTAGKFMTLDDHQLHLAYSADVLDPMIAMTFMVQFWALGK